MSRPIIIIQLCALLCLLASLATEPSCDGPFKEHLEICVYLSQRWYQLQHEYGSQDCSHLKQGQRVYYACMAEVGKKATNRLISELESGLLQLLSEDAGGKATRGFYNGGALVATARRNAAGDLMPRKKNTASNDNKDKSFLQSIISFCKFW